MTDTSLLREVGVGQGGTSVEMWPCSIEMLVCKLHVCTETRRGVVTSECPGFTYPPGYSRRVSGGTDKGTTSHTLAKPCTLQQG